MGSEDEFIIGALAPREIIGRAVDLLRAEHDVSTDDAFEILVRGSSDARESVRTHAAAILRRSTDEQSARLRALAG